MSCLPSKVLTSTDPTEVVPAVRRWTLCSMNILDSYLVWLVFLLVSVPYYLVLTVDIQ